jgi:hypothetical protein
VGLILATVFAFTGSAGSYLMEDSCAVIERNQVYGEHFKERRFVQLIFWDMRRKRDHVTDEFSYGLWIGDWKIVKSASVHYSHSRREWVAIFYDDQGGLVRVVTAASFRDTETNYDVEIRNRKRLPVNQRTPILSRP